MGSQQPKSEHGSESPTFSDWDQCLDFTIEKNHCFESFFGQMSNVLPNETASLCSSCSSQSAATSGCWNDNGGIFKDYPRRFLSQNSTSSSPYGSYNCDNDGENSELMGSEELSRSSSDFGDVKVRGCLLQSRSTTFGHTISIGTCAALDESVQFKEKNQVILPMIRDKLKNHWLQMKNQQLENAQSINISDCPMADVKDESGTVVNIDFDAHRSILLDGFFWSGKTIFARQHAVNWAHNRGQLTNFKLVFFLDKRNLDASIDRALLQQAAVDNEDPAVIWKIIQINQKHIFIIIDDFDLLTESATKQAHELLDGLVLPGAHVLATCKPGRSAEMEKSFNKHFSMSLFDEKQIDRFFRAFGKDIRSKVHQMLHVDCRDILQFPLFLHVLCVIAETKPEQRVNNNITNVYELLISDIVALKGWDSDFRKFFVEFGDICCRWGSSCDALKNFNLKNTKLMLELMVRPDEPSSGELCSQRNFAFFAIALYLSRLTDDSSFGLALQNTFRNIPDVSELFYRFLVGLIEDKNKIDDVFHLLPRRLTQSWNMDLINIFGEAGVFSDANRAQFAANMPSWIRLEVAPAISCREQHGFSVVRPIAVVKTDLNPGLNSHLCSSSKIIHHLVSLFELKTCPITFLDLDFMDKNEKCLSDFVLDLLTGINGLDKVTRVRVRCSQITGFICDVIAHLFQHVKRVELRAATDSGFVKLIDYLFLVLNLPKIEYLDICIDSSSTDHILTWKEVKILYDLLKKCQNLSELRLKPVASERRIFDAIFKLKLKKVVIGSRTKGKKSPADLVLRMASQSAVEYLDVSGLHVDASRLDEAFGLVSNGQLKSLRVVDFTFGKLPGVDLSVLAPPNRCWDLLDLSGWRISCACASSDCGSIKSLVVLGCVCTNLLEIIDVFSVEKLVCDDEHLDFSKAGKCPLGLEIENGGEFEKCWPSLIKLTVKCDNSRQISTQICNFGHFFPNLLKLKLMFAFERFDLDVGVWEELKKVEKLDVVHLVFLDWSKSVFENIKVVLQLDIGKLKLTFDASQLGKRDFGSFDALFDSIHEQLEKKNLKVVQISHKSFNYNEFLTVLEAWEKEKCLNLSVKLIKCNKLSETNVTTVELSLYTTHPCT